MGTEVEIEAAYEDLCAEMSQEYIGDKDKDSFWPNSLQNKFSGVRNIDTEFSKIEREGERKLTTMKENFAEDEFTRMEEQRKFARMDEERRCTKFTMMEEQEDDQCTSSSPTEEWIGVVVEEVGPLFGRPFSPRAGPTSVTPQPTRDYCSTERALNSEPRDDRCSNPLAKKSPLPATSLPTHGLTMQKLPTQLKIPIFAKPQETITSNNENSQRPITTIQFGDENKIPLFSRPLSPEAVQQWSADMKRRDSFGLSSSCGEARNVKYSEKENSQQQQQTLRTSQKQQSDFSGHSL